MNEAIKLGEGCYMSTINERISILIRELGMNNNSFAKEIGVNPAVTFNIIEGRRTKPSFELLEKMLLAYDNINSEWLLKGTGNIFKLSIDGRDVSSKCNEGNISDENIKKIILNQEKLLYIISQQIIANEETNKRLLNLIEQQIGSVK